MRTARSVALSTRRVSTLPSLPFHLNPFARIASLSFTLVSPLPLIGSLSPTHAPYLSSTPPPYRHINIIHLYPSPSISHPRRPLWCPAPPLPPAATTSSSPRAGHTTRGGGRCSRGRRPPPRTSQAAASRASDATRPRSLRAHALPYPTACVVTHTPTMALWPPLFPPLTTACGATHPLSRLHGMLYLTPPPSFPPPVASLTLWNATKGTSVPATDPQNELRAVSVVFNGGELPGRWGALMR